MTTVMRARSLSLVLAVALAACGGGGTLTTTDTPTVTATPTGAAVTVTPTIAGTPASTPGMSAAPSLRPGAVLVAGTHVALVPPDGFVESATFVGFEHESGASILVAELPASYAELIAGMTDERFEQQGITVVSRREVTVDGRASTLVEGTQVAAGITFGKVMLLTGTDALTAFVTGNFPITEVAVGDGIRASELSLSFDPARSIDPQAALRFTLTPVAPLQFAGVLNNGALYNTSGLIPSADAGEPSLIVAPSFGVSVVGDPIAFSRSLLDGMQSIGQVEVESATEATIAGRPAVITLATARSSTRDDRMFVYQVVLGGDDDYVVLLGTCDPDQRAAFVDVFADTVASYTPKP